MCLPIRRDTEAQTGAEGALPGVGVEGMGCLWGACQRLPDHSLPSS